MGFDGNGITHLATHPKLQKILSPHPHPNFPKRGNAPNTQNSYSSTLWYPLGLYNPSLDAKLRFKINELRYLVQQFPKIGANAQNAPNVVKFNSQLAKEKVIATNKITNKNCH